MRSVSKLLIDAAAMLRARGFAQREIVADDGRVCALGALLFANDGLASGPYQQAAYELCRSIGYQMSVNSPTSELEKLVAEFNDAYFRNDVENIFGDAILRVEQSESSERHSDEMVAG